MTETTTSRIAPLEETVQQIVRRAGCLAAGRQVAPEDLWQAAHAFAGAPLPPATVRLTSGARDVLTAASALAQVDRRHAVTSADLLEALREWRVKTACLDLPRLRFVRWRLQRQYGVELHARHFVPATT